MLEFIMGIVIMLVFVGLGIFALMLLVSAWLKCTTQAAFKFVASVFAISAIVVPLIHFIITIFITLLGE